MIKVENIETWGFEHAVRGMRNPMNSWDKSDSDFHGEEWKLGERDLALMRKLYNGGTEHRKFLRQIMVSMDITAPLYWWKEFDTYKVGTVANSCSTMHKIAEKEFALNDFSHDHLTGVNMICDPNALLEHAIDTLNEARLAYISTKDKKYWWVMIQLLPSSYNQRRTITMNYENAVTIIKQRSWHRLDEWRDFVIVLREWLPYLCAIMEEA